MSAFARLRDGWPGPEAELRVLSASGQLGLGIPEAAFRAGIARKPHVIAADMGSVDPGPSYLGSGQMAAPAEMAKRDLKLVLDAARALDVPLLIGSAGTAGAAPHLAATEALLREVAGAHRFRLATIAADVPAESVRAAPLTPIGPIEAQTCGTPHIVAQMGQAPFAEALAGGADVILAGRACDTAPFAVIPWLLGYPRGVAVHMAKILECTSLACTPGGRDAMLATLRGDHFDLESMNPARAATPLSVAAHALYEQAEPHVVAEPEGWADLSGATYTALDDRRCRVAGAVWHDAARAIVKIEGARAVGHRAVMLAAAADPAFIAASGEIIEGVIAAVRGMVPGEWTLSFRRFGIDGVVDWPTPPQASPREIFLYAEAIAETPQTARAVAATARQQMLHWGFEGRMATGGNLAFPLTPPELDAGAAYEFSLYHLMELPDGEALRALFPVTYHDIGET